MEKKKQQPALSVSEQVRNLRELGLELGKEENAEQLLNNISYFRLIKAFSLGLKPKNGSYRPGVTLDQIVALYNFNCELRHLLFPVIERIEVTLRCRIGNYFSGQYGVLGYEDAENFADEQYHQAFLEDIAAEISRNARSPFVKNFRDHYENGKIPMYAAVELFSFGTLSKFFKNMKNADKKAVASTYGVGYTYFESWIESIAYVRNLCAHYGRLYNAKLAKKPMLYKQGMEKGIDNTRVFGVIVCMSKLVPHDELWMVFVDALSKLLEKHPELKREAIGFPEDWRTFLE